MLTQTNTALINLSMSLLRIMTGIILFGAGAGKVLKWFGGFGMDMTVKYYAMSGINTPLAYMSAYTEFIGGFLLIIGLLTRPAAFAVMINMLVATIVTWPKGFLTGAAFPLSLAVSSLIILLTGPMDYSVDALLFRNKPVNN